MDGWLLEEYELEWDQDFIQQNISNLLTVKIGPVTVFESLGKKASGHILPSMKPPFLLTMLHYSFAII